MSQYFELIHTLGQGSFGTVFKALDKVHNRYVALKVLHPEHAQDSGIVQQFFREALVLTRLEHPGIPKILYLGPFVNDEGQKTYALAQEFFEGQNLAEYLESNPYMPVDEAIHLFTQLCLILEYAHQRKVIHRDLKPSNIFLSKEGPKILDFGIAKISWVQAVNTAPGGTLVYAAPEQLTKERRVRTQSDIFSMGVLLYEVLTGNHPSMLKVSHYFRWIKENNPPALKLPNVSTPLQKKQEEQLQLIFKGMVENRPRNRFLTAKAVSRALRSVTGMLTDSAPALEEESSNLRILFSWIDPKRDPYYRRRNSEEVQVGPNLRILESKQYKHFFDHFVLLTPNQAPMLEQAKRLSYRVESQGLLRQNGEVHICTANLENPWDIAEISQFAGNVSQEFERHFGDIEKFVFVSTGTTHAQSGWFLSQAQGSWEGSTFLQMIPSKYLAPGEPPVHEMDSNHFRHFAPTTPTLSDLFSVSGQCFEETDEQEPETPTFSMLPEHCNDS